MPHPPYPHFRCPYPHPTPPLSPPLTPPIPPLHPPLPSHFTHPDPAPLSPPLPPPYPYLKTSGTVTPLPPSLIPTFHLPYPHLKTCGMVIPLSAPGPSHVPNLMVTMLPTNQAGIVSAISCTDRQAQTDEEQLKESYTQRLEISKLRCQALVLKPRKLEL